MMTRRDRDSSKSPASEGGEWWDGRLTVHAKFSQLLTHLYEFFGTLLGCSEQGKDDFSAYNGEASMYEVHK